jgi:hypothetical protein
VKSYVQLAPELPPGDSDHVSRDDFLEVLEQLGLQIEVSRSHEAFHHGVRPEGGGEHIKEVVKGMLDDNLKGSASDITEEIISTTSRCCQAVGTVTLHTAESW